MEMFPCSFNISGYLIVFAILTILCKVIVASCKKS